MRQSLHLLIVDRARRSVLVTRHGSRWLLPILSCHERLRADPSIGRWTAEQGVPGDVVGHWLGRLTPAADSMDWLVAISAQSGSCAATPAYSWAPIETLVGGASLLDYQQWAVETTLQRGPLPSVLGPFGNLTWLDEVRGWVSETVGQFYPCQITPHRVSAHEVVLGATTRSGRVYFKGLASKRCVEARLTRTLSVLAPDSFAPTLALESRPDGCVWWLAAECPGLPCRCGEPVARALARTQRRVMASGPVIRELRDVDLEAAAAWSIELLNDGRGRAAIDRACDAVRRARVPQCWIPLDLDPSNVLVDDSGGVRFIDLDDSFIGPAPLALAVFARRCRDTSLYGSYEQAWSPPLKGVDWPGFETAAAVLEAWLGWNRVKLNTERGEVHGVLGLAGTRTAQRLAAAVDHA
jgi:hypothetical protein